MDDSNIGAIKTISHRYFEMCNADVYESDSAFPFILIRVKLPMVGTISYFHFLSVFSSAFTVLLTDFKLKFRNVYCFNDFLIWVGVAWCVRVRVRISVCVTYRERIV